MSVKIIFIYIFYIFKKKNECFFPSRFFGLYQNYIKIKIEISYCSNRFMVSITRYAVFEVEKCP